MQLFIEQSGPYFLKVDPPGPFSAQPAQTACTASRHISHTKASGTFPFIGFGHRLIQGFFLNSLEVFQILLCILAERQGGREGAASLQLLAEQLRAESYQSPQPRPSETTCAASRCVLLEQIKPYENPEM